MKKNKQKHKTTCVGHHYAQTNTTNVNKTWSLLQTTGRKDENECFWIYRDSTYSYIATDCFCI
jgi:hypothetical protein